MKQAFGECRFNDKAEITKSSFLRTIPKVTGMDKNDVVQLFYAIEEDPQANSLSGEKIFKYFEEILHMEDNISWELNYIRACCAKEESPTLLKYLCEEIGFTLDKDLLK